MLVTCSFTCCIKIVVANSIISVVFYPFVKEPDWAAIARREEENHAKAEERFREALKELKSQRLQHCERQNR